MHGYNILMFLIVGKLVKKNKYIYISKYSSNFAQFKSFNYLNIYIEVRFYEFFFVLGVQSCCCFSHAPTEVGRTRQQINYALRL